MSITESDLMNMKLHEFKKINSTCEIQRVLGGWVYTTFNNDCTNFSSVFVPEPTKRCK
jgi:hypothetical protein